MLVYAASNGIVVHTLPLLYPELIEEFGWTAAQMTLPATAFFIFGAITSPPAGALLDRFSPRIMLMIGSLGILVSLVFCAAITALWHMVAVYLLFGLSLSLCGLTASMVVLTRWFDGLRGRATGFLLMASSFGGAAFPQLLGMGVAEFGWRTAVLILAGCAAVLTLIPLILMVKDRPEQARTARAAQSIAIEAGPTLAQALRNPDFYLLAVATGGMWFAIVALLQNQSIHLARDVGIAPALLPTVFSIFFVCSVLGKLGFGWISDVIDKELAFILSITTFAAGLIVITTVEAGQSGALYFYAVLAGIGFSGVFTTIQLSIANLFAGQSYGKILAILVMIDSLAGGIGTSVIANMRDATGSYDSAFGLMIAICCVSAICVATIRWRKPRPIEERVPQ